MAIDTDRELLILGFLGREPMSAYDVNRVVKMHAPVYKTFARGNLYAQLRQLQERGLLSSRAVSAARGPRDTKTVYRLTAAGRKRFDELLAAVFADVQAPDAELEVACVLLGRLSRTRAQALLQLRLEVVAAQEKRLERLHGSFEERSAAGQLSMMHTIVRLRAEATWLLESLALLRNQKWQPQWGESKADGSIDDTMSG